MQLIRRTTINGRTVTLWASTKGKVWAVRVDEYPPEVLYSMADAIEECSATVAAVGCRRQ